MFAMRSLLQDRLLGEQREEEEEKGVCASKSVQRSVYRQLLFLRYALYPCSFNIGE